MKRIFLLLVFMAMILPAFSQKVQIGQLYYKLDSSTKTAEVTYENSYYNESYVSDALTIPETVTYNGTKYSVTSIGEYAFFSCSGLTSVTIPNSVTSIGKEAFEYCRGLTSVVIPNSVTSIGVSAFKGCSGLTSVVIPNSITEIGISTFSGCSGLTSVTIPNSVTSIGSYAFKGCSGLTSVTIPNSVTSIGDWAFYLCSGLTSVVIPNSVTEIGSYAFSDCIGLTSVTIPNSVTSIGEEAFVYCSGLTSVEFNAENCQKCGSRSYPAFPPNFTELTIGNNVKTIPAYAFYGCWGLTNVTIGKSVTSIGVSAFGGCPLTSIILENETPPTYYSVFSEYAQTATLKLPNTADLTAYLNSNWKNFQNIDWEGRKFFLDNDGVFEYAFIENLGEAYLISSSKYNNMTSASIPDRVVMEINGVESFYRITGISANAFKGCSKLTQVKIPANCEVIGSSAFEGCSRLTSVNISDIEAWCKIDFGNVTANPIYYAKNLSLNNEIVTSLSIPASITEIKNYAFYNCQSIKGDLQIANSIRSIGTNAFANIEFENCIMEDGIEALEFTGDNKINAKNLYLGRTINGTIFYSGLESLEVSGFVESIPSNCFSNNPLTSLIINPGSGIVIEDGAFKGCSQLAEITLPEDITEIGANAFSGTALKNITVPNGTIGANAFANCNLDNIIIGAGVKSIGEKAFDGSNAIKNVYATPTTPPNAENNTFSYYEAQLYVPQEAIDTYYNFTRCWYRFCGKPLVMPERIEVSGPETISGNPGETFQLTATISPSNVTLDRVLWTSTNPAIATVDNDGLVTIHNFVSDEALTRAASTVQCQIIASTLYEDSPVAVVSITNNVEDTSIDYINPEESGAGWQNGAASNDIYTLQGVCLKRNATPDDLKTLVPGIYIIGGKKVVKN